MKVLWIVNSVLNSLSKHLYNKESNGLWMQALLNDYKKNRDFDLVIVTTIKTNKTIKMIDDGITYYTPTTFSSMTQDVQF